MGKKITQGGGGPGESGSQGEPGGGSGTVTDRGIHYTDYSKTEPHKHNSWDERGSNVSNEHTTAGKDGDKGEG